jgi:hypothetical protein
VGHVAVFSWIKSFEEKLEEFRNPGNIEVIELDEMHTYIGSKKAIAGSGLLLLIEMGTGSSIVKLVGFNRIKFLGYSFYQIKEQKPHFLIMRDSDEYHMWFLLYSN